ncbi:MAG: HmuY family protein [Sphingobacteriales bacterium]|jgi:hypothetical protein
MRKRTIRTVFFGLLASTFLITSCEKNEITKTQAATVTTVRDLIADTIVGISSIGQPYGAGKFTLYSLQTNKVIPNSDSATAKWDLGFRGTTIITNSGISGPGNGGAFVYVGTFEELIQVPTDSTFRSDLAANNLAIPVGSNRAWYVYNAPANLITPIPGRVLVIRTASQKFAKVEILNYYKGGITPAATASDNEKIFKQRYYTFRFLLQPDGSKKLN